MLATNSPVRRYLVPLLAVLVVIGVKLAFDPLGRSTPFILLALAVIASGAFGGVRSAILATIVSAAAALYFFLPPYHSFAIDSPDTFAQLAVFTAEGLAIAGIVGALQRARNRLATANARKAAVMDAALDAIVVMSADGTIVDFNHAAETMFGHRREDVVGRPLADVIVPESLRAKHRAGLARYVRTGEAHVLGKRIELTALRKSGEEFPVELAIAATVGAGRTTFTGYLRDITERKDHETARLRLAQGDREGREQAERATERVARLQKLTAALSAARTPEDVARVVVEEGADALGATTGAMAVPRDPEGHDRVRELSIIATRGIPEETVAALRIVPTDGPYPTAVAFRTGQPQWIESPDEYVEHYAELAKMSGGSAAASAALPLVLEGRTLGAIAFRFAERRSVTRDEKSLMVTFAEQAAQALDRAALFARESATRRRLEELGALTAALSTTLDRRDVARVVVERGMRLSNADTCTLYVLDARDGSLELIGDRGVAPEVLDRIRRIARGSENSAAEQIATGKSVWAENEQEYAAIHPSFAAMKVTTGKRAKAFWSVPLIVENRPIGLLGMGFYSPRHFSKAERTFVETFTQQCAQALARAQRVESERAAHAAAEAARSSLATTLRSIGDAVITTDTDGKVTFINPIAEALTGWTDAEARGQPLRSVFQIINESTRREVESPVTKVLRDGVIVGLANHTVLVSKNGEVPIDDSGAPIRDDSGVVRGVVLVFRSVSSEKRAEARRAFLVEASAALASSLDERATLSRVAQLAVPRLADWCGIDVVAEGHSTPEQVAVAHIDPTKVELARDLGRRYPPDPNGKTGAPNVVRTGRSEFYPEIPDELLVQGAIDAEHLRISRELALRSAIVVPLKTRRRVLGAITLVYAESNRRYSEDDLAFAEDFGSRAAIAIENARLFAAEQRAREIADTSNRAKDEFLATISHELRTPLNAILGWSRMMSSLDDGKRQHAVDVIDRNATAMARLIEDLLDVSRIISGKLRLDINAVDLSSVIDATVDSLRPAADAKRIRLSVVKESGDASVRGDSARLQQVVWNLLSNAVKFTPRDGRIDIVLRRLDSFVELRVTDTGKGIAPEFLPFVFDAFRQADGSITRSHGGLGLGLAITRQLVELHGGRVEAKSDGEGRGATFVVRLPLSVMRDSRPSTPAASAPRAMGSLDCPQELAGLHILVVDDEPDARDLLRAVLERCGSRVTLASSAAAAMAAIEREVPDVMVSDIGMPDENGFDLIRKVRALPASRGGEIPAAALTAYARAEDRREVLHAGYMMHVAKPVEPADLVAVIASLARYSAKVRDRSV